jgi:hypothetical protein
LHYLFDQIKQPAYEHIDFSIKLFLIEIYNDKIYDLLPNDEDQPELKMKGSGTPADPFHIKDVTEISVSNLKEALYMLQISQNLRRSGDGGKSHFIANLTIVQENLITKISKIGELCFIDLAGCERIDDMRACLSEEQMQVNKNINKGLSALSLCIENLSNGKKGDFRSCNLTK